MALSSRPNVDSIVSCPVEVPAKMVENILLRTICLLEREEDGSCVVYLSIDRRSYEITLSPALRSELGYQARIFRCCHQYHAMRPF
jgi:hypothetical protein